MTNDPLSIIDLSQKSSPAQASEQWLDLNWSHDIGDDAGILFMWVGC